MLRPPSSGLILCGGASRRMGRDKALLLIERRTLLERAAARLAGLCDEVVLACGAEPRHADLGFALALDRAPGLGPLAGLEAGLAAARHEFVLAVAVDMPRLEEAPLEALLAELVGAVADGADACLAEGPRGVEPLCGAWRTSALGAVRAALDAGERRVLAAFDPRRLGSRAAKLVCLEVESSAWAENLNTPEELAAHADRGRA